MTYPKPTTCGTLADAVYVRRGQRISGDGSRARSSSGHPATSLSHSPPDRCMSSPSVIIGMPEAQQRVPNVPLQTRCGLCKLVRARSGAMAAAAATLRCVCMPSRRSSTARTEDVLGSRAPENCTRRPQQERREYAPVWMAWGCRAGVHGCALCTLWISYRKVVSGAREVTHWQLCGFALTHTRNSHARGALRCKRMVAGGARRVGVQVCNPPQQWTKLIGEGAPWAITVLGPGLPLVGSARQCDCGCMWQSVQAPQDAGSLQYKMDSRELPALPRPLAEERGSLSNRTWAAALVCVRTGNMALSHSAGANEGVGSADRASMPQQVY